MNPWAEIVTRSDRFREEITKVLQEHYSDRKFYTLSQLAHRSTVGSRVCQYPDKTRPTLLAITINGKLDNLMFKYMVYVSRIHGLPQVKDDLSNLKEVTDKVWALVDQVGYTLRFVEIPGLHHLQEAIRQIEDVDKVVDITIAEMD